MGNTPSTNTVAQSSVSKLKDTTFRSVLFQKPEVEIVANQDGKMVLKDQIDPSLFDSYEHYLKFMAQLSRLVYCDSGVIREVLLSPEFGGSDNKLVNSKITEIDRKYLTMKIQPSSFSNSKNGRPMVSYATPESSKTGDGILTYVSSPSDLTFVLMKGDFVSSKIPIFKSSDLIISFKGSSTIKNFKHDIYSQFTPTDLSTLLPSPSSSGQIGNVPSSFVNPILKSWNILIQQLKKYNPVRIFITGHSLGGAYATIFSFILCELKSMFPSVQSLHVVTFGSPTLVADKARNTFNKHLDSGFVTLDRVVSVGLSSKLIDLIPTIPAGFSHPGFQPLHTELYPEKRTGRAYSIENIRKVFQKGGLLGFGSEKNKYEIDTKIHMPNKVSIPTYTLAGNSFAHAEYFDMTWINAFRIVGMKNPGFNGNTFVAEIFDDGITFKYVTADPTEEPISDPTDSVGDIDKIKNTGAMRKTYKVRVNKSNKRKTHRSK